MALPLARKPIRWQRKDLLSPVTTSTTVTALGFSNLVVGRTYRLSAFARLAINSPFSGNEQVLLDFAHNGSSLFFLFHRVDTNADTSEDNASADIIFVATGTTIVAATTLVGSGNSVQNGFVILEELPDHEQVSAF